MKTSLQAAVITLGISLLVAVPAQAARRRTGANARQRPEPGRDATCSYDPADPDGIGIVEASAARPVC